MPKDFYGRKLIALTLVILGVFSALSAAQAQDNDEQAMVERVVAAIHAVSTYTSMEIVREQRSSTELTSRRGDEVLDDQTMEYTLNSTETVVITGNGPNLHRQVLAQGTTVLGEQSEIAYSFDLEVRLVDGAVYVKAAYPAPNPDLPDLPENWIIVDANNLTDWVHLIAAGNLFPLVDEENRNDTIYLITGTSLADSERMLTDIATSVTGAAATLEDGTPVEQITFTLNQRDLLLADDHDSSNPFQNAIVEGLADAPITLVFSLDDQGNLVEMTSTATLDIADAPLSEDNDTRFTYYSHDVSTLRFTSANELLEPVAAPDSQTSTTQVPVVVDLPWWNDRVFYEIFVRSFYDSDGDGIGDLQGVIEKLDYLNDGDPTTTDDLGVTGIWLMPIAQSPSYHGYDVTDYFTVEEDYGTNEDFLRLMDEAHQRGMVVIVDLVMNHTSSEHPWFLASASGDPDYADWYLWSDEPPDVRGPWGQKVWHKARDRYFFGLFWEGMPDLNYENPEVTDAMHEVIRFWLEDMGADGFRLDAIKHLFEEGSQMENVPATLTWLEGFHAYVRSIDPDALTVGEVWSSTPIVVSYIGERVDLAFEFDLAGAILQAAQTGRARPLSRLQTSILEQFPAGQYAAFLTNHDQNRVMNTLGGDPARAKVAATLLLTNPGVPFIYYGEEIGMTGAKPDERIRTPMQWSRDGGFTSALPWEPLADDCCANNVADMAADPDSLLNHYRNLIHLRNDHPALQEGAMILVDSTDLHIYSYLRYTEDDVLLIVVNLSDETVEDYTLTLAAGPLSGSPTVEVLMGEGTATAPTLNASGGFDSYTPLSSLPPQSSFIVRLSS